jgi:drug/metabolite transporter (DMT)-like permease
MTFVVVRRALVEIPVFHLLTYRFGLGALALGPFLLRGMRDPGARRFGLRLGLVLFAAFALQTSGLLWTTPSRSAFLTALSVVLVPLFAWAVLRRTLSWRAVAGSLLAVGGLWTLYRPGLGTASAFGAGDFLSLAGATAYAAHILVTERAVVSVPIRPLVAVQFATVALLASPSLLIQLPTWREVTGGPLLAIVLLGLFATAVAFTLQVFAQTRISAIEVALILALEPVVAAAFSVAVGEEPWTSTLAVGGSLVLAGMVLVESGPDPVARPADHRLN